MLALIDSVSDPFATEIYYHRSCWKFYVKPVYEESTSNIESSNTTDYSSEVNKMFFDHVQKVFFDFNESRTLIGLLLDYTHIVWI